MEQRVVAICLDTPEFLGTFWGAIKIGAVPVPVNTLLRAADFRYVFDDTRARWPSSRPRPRRGGGGFEGARHLRHVLVAGGAPGPHLSYEARVARASRFLEAAPTSRDDVAFWLYSSGSTGRPKGAVHLHHDMVIAAETYSKQVLGMRATDKFYSAAKLFFAYGLGNAGYFPMSVGAQSVLYPHRPTPDAVFELIARHRPTIFFGVPTLYAAMLAAKDAERRFDLSSLRLCVSAGEALPADLYRRWHERFGVEIVDGIGTTETGHIFLSNRPGAVRPGSSGLPVPGYECAIVDDEGRPVPAGEIGNLRVRGDSTMAYYWNKHDKTKETLFGPWIQTGDKYHRDTEGYFWYDGRGDDMLKVGGIWVSPIEVEATLISTTPSSRPRWSARRTTTGWSSRAPTSCSRSRPGPGRRWPPSPRVRQGQDRAVQVLPRWIDFVPELPKTATGKIQRFKLRQSLAGV
jgi:benzoate-CoA ligase